MSFASARQLHSDVIDDAMLLRDDAAHTADAASTPIAYVPHAYANSAFDQQHAESQRATIRASSYDNLSETNTSGIYAAVRLDFAVLCVVLFRDIQRSVFLLSWVNNIHLASMINVVTHRAGQI
jgi:hypothetical protein